MIIFIRDFSLNMKQKLETLLEKEVLDVLRARPEASLDRKVKADMTVADGFSWLICKYGYAGHHICN